MTSIDQDRAAVSTCGPGLLSRVMIGLASGALDGLVNIIIFGVFAILILLPLGLVLIQAFMPALFDPLQPRATIDAASIARTFGAPRLMTAITNSLLLAGCVAVTATSLGAGYAFILHRTNVPFRSLLSTVPWLVFLTPAYLKAMAWTLLMAHDGYFSQIGLVPEALSNIFFGPAGLVFLHTLNLFPLPYFVIGRALAGLGSEFEDAARLAGARLGRVWIRINLPLLAPAFALCVVAVFAEVLSDFGLASTIARQSGFGLLTYSIYVAASAYPVDFALAGCQALILLLMVVTLVLADQLLRRQAAVRLISARSRPARAYSLGPARWVLAAFAFAIAMLALCLPLAAVIARALSRTLSAGLVRDNITLEFVRAAVNPGNPNNQALMRSLAFAGIAATAAATIAVLLALRLERGSRFMRPAVLGISLGAVAIPGIVLGFGYILVWNRIPLLRDLPFPRYGHASLLVMGYTGAALPYCLVIMMSALGQLAPNLTEAARLHGAGWLRRTQRIVLPLVAFSLVTALLSTFIRTMFELPMSELLVPVDGPAAPSVLVQLFGKDDEGMGSALSLMAMIVVAVVSAAIWITARYVAAQSRAVTAPAVSVLASARPEGVTM